MSDDSGNEYLVPCKVCDEPILRHTSTWFCSRRCSQYASDHPGAVAKKKRRNCEMCGVEYLALHQLEKFCSKTCQAGHARRRRGETTFPYVVRTICETCGGPIKNRVTRTTRYCSPECGNYRSAEDVAASRQRTASLKPIPCVGCGKLFSPLYSYHIACSQKCVKAAWKLAHPDYYTVKSRERYMADPEKFRLRQAEWRANNLERARERQREYNRLHPEKVTIQRQARRSRKRSNPDGRAITNEQWARVLRRSGGRCYYCGVIPKSWRLTMEHVIPLSRGGRHALGNVVPACMSCNSRKKNMLLAEWRYRREPALCWTTTSGRATVHRGAGAQNTA